MHLPSPTLYDIAAPRFLRCAARTRHTSHTHSNFACGRNSAPPPVQLIACASAAAEPSQYAEVVVWSHAPPAPAAASSTASTTRGAPPPPPRHAKLAVLHYHPVAVEALAFSGDGRHLVSVGRDPERAVAVWDVGELLRAAASAQLPGAAGAQQAQARLAGVGRTRAATSGAAWLPAGGVGGGSPPRFVTAGEEGLLLWTLTATHLEQVPLRLPDPHEGLEGAGGRREEGETVTAVGVDAAGVVVAADARGCVWEVQLAADGDAGGGGLAAMRHVADLPGATVTRVAADGEGSAGGGGVVALGTLGGLVTTYS